MNKPGELTAYFERSELAIRDSPLSGKIYSAYGIEPKYHITIIEVSINIRRKNGIKNIRKI
jgi:hypothetical protein